MSIDLPDRLRAGLERLPDGPLAVAFSGGLDSSVLLHALAALPAARRRGLRALHVDHRLRAESSDWARRCMRACAALGLRCDVLEVEVARDRASLEDAARDARYAALLAALAAGETLALAHHRDDQAETVLLRLLRGAGSAGLAAMRETSERGNARLWRPLLELPRTALADYARAHALEWVEDPANRDPRHRRNHLRHRVLPLLREQWPQAEAALAASARLLAEDAALLDDLAAEALAGARGLDPCTLSVPALRALAPALRRHAVRRWLRDCGMPSAPATILQRIGPELLDAAIDAEPRLAWAGAELLRYRDVLHCSPDAALPPTDWQLDWDGSAPLLLPGAFGCLQLGPDAPALPPMQVRPRRGGERIRLPRRGHGSALKKVLQSLAIPPWERRRLPLLFAADDGELLAAGDLALSERFDRLLQQHGTALRWHAPVQ